MEEYTRRDTDRSVGTAPTAEPAPAAMEPSEPEIPFIEDAVESPAGQQSDEMAPDQPVAIEGAADSQEHPGTDEAEGSTPNDEAAQQPDAADDYIFDLLDDHVDAQFEFNGNALDVGDHERDGVLIGGEFVGTDFGQGLRVSDSEHGFDWSQYSAFLSHPYTIEFVFTPEDASATFSKLLSPEDDEDDGWYLYGAGFRTYPIQGVTAGSDMIPFGAQTYLAVVSTSASEVDVYINGQRVTESPISSQLPMSPDHAIFFRDDSRVSRYETLHAVIDALRISSVSRTADEVMAVQTRLQTR